MDRGNHDTVAIAALDTRGSLAVATSTNGVAHKLPGRVGDAAVPGAGGYAVTGVGACGATGDGDTMMRFLPCYQAVESLRLGWSPQAAADDAVARVAARAPAFVGALFVLSADGRLHAGAAHGWSFQYTVLRAGDEAPRVFTVNPAAAARPCGRGRLLGRAAALARRAAAALAARLPRGRRALAAASFAAGALAGAGCAAAVRGRAAGGGGLKEVDY